MKPFSLTISAIFSLILFAVGLYEIKELNLYHRYSIYYGSTVDYEGLRRHVEENEIYAAVFWIVGLAASLLVFWIINKRVNLKKIESNKGRSYPLDFTPVLSPIQIILVSLLTTTSITFSYINVLEEFVAPTLVFSRPFLFTELSVVAPPESVKSNESLPIKVKQSLVHGDAGIGKQMAVQNSEYQATVRLQSAFGAPSSLQDWQPKKPLAIYESVEWNWILKPDVDRYGSQKILIEGAVYGNNNELVCEAAPVLIAIDVETPLGLPSWIAYLTTFLGGVFGLAFVGWLWMFVYERYLKQNHEEKRDSLKTKHQRIKKSPK